MNKCQIKNVRNGALGILLVLYVVMNYLQPCLKRLAFLLITTVLTFCLFEDLCSAIILSIVLSMIYTVLCRCKCNNIVEGLQNKKKDNEKEDSGFSDNFIDYNETMRNNLKNIDTKNIEKMTNETKELLQTQKQLMKTMSEMAPLLKQGMGLVDMFKKTDLNKNK